MQITKELIPIKLYYFISWAGFGPLHPFLPVITRQKGVPEHIIGIIWGVLPLIDIIGKTINGAIADFFRMHRGVIMYTVLINMAAYTGIFFTPSIFSSDDTCINKNATEEEPVFTYDLTGEGLGISYNLSEGVQGTNYSLSEEAPNIQFNFTTEATLISNCTDPLYTNKNDLQSVGEVSSSQIFGSFIFWILFICLMASQISVATFHVLGDTICFNLLGNDHSLYGKQRVYGTFGWGLAAAAGGALIDWYSKGLPQPDLTPAYLMSVVAFILDLLLLTMCLKVSVTPHKTDFGAVTKIFKIPSAVLMLVSATVAGCGCGFIATFQYILIEDVTNENHPDFNHMKLIHGLFVFFECIIGETPVLIFVGAIIAKLGHFMAFFISLVSMSLRLCLYTIVTSPWAFLPVGLFHGLTWGISYTSCVSYANSIKIKGTEATVQAIFGIANTSSYGLGSLIGGWLYSTLKGRMAFLIMGISVGIYSVIFITLHFIIKRFETQETSTSKDHGSPEVSLEEVKSA